MNLETQIATIQEITRQSIERFRQKQWQRVVARSIDGGECTLGDCETFMAGRARAEALVEKARRAFPIAVEAMGEVADAMGWPWVTPGRWKWLNFWRVEYLMGYAAGKACTASSGEGILKVCTCTASVGIDVWRDAEEYEPDLVPVLSFCFLDHCEWLELTEGLVSDERMFREVCASAIVKAYRAYALADEFVPLV